MSSTALDSAVAQWQTQLAAMRAALADLKLPTKSPNGVSSTYDSEFNFDDDDDEFTSGSSGDDVWDFISDSEGVVCSSDPNDLIPESSGSPNAGGYGLQWLTSQCIGFAGRKQGLSVEDLQAQIMALLASDSVEEEEKTKRASAPANGVHARGRFT